MSAATGDWYFEIYMPLTFSELNVSGQDGIIFYPNTLVKKVYSFHVMDIYVDSFTLGIWLIK